MTQSRRFSFLPRSAGAVAWLAIAIVVAISGLALVGHVLGNVSLMSLNPRSTPMRVITAVCLLLSAAALACLVGKTPVRWKMLVARSCGVVVGVVGLVSVAAYLVELRAGQEWFWGHQAFLSLFLDQDTTRMAVITAILFTIFGGILLLLASGRRLAADVSHATLLPVTMLTYLVLVGYLFHVRAFYDWMHLGVALNTGIAFSALCLGSFCVRPDTWLMRVFSGQEAGAAMARRLLPAVLVLPLVIGWFRIQGERSGYYASEMGVALVAVTYTVCFVLLVWVNAKAVNRTDRGRRKAEEDRSRLAAIVEFSDDAILSKDLAGIILTWNDGAERLFGYRADEVIGRSVALLLPLDRLAEEEGIVNRLRAGQRVEHLETVRVAKDGRHLDVLVTSSPLKDHAGQIVGVSKIVRDITERKQAEEALAQSERRLRTILEALPVGIFLSDSQGNVVFTNPAVGRIWGISDHVSREQYGHYTGRFVVSGRAVEPDQWALARTLDTGLPFTNDLVEIPGGQTGRKIIHNYALPIRGEAGQLLGVVVVTEDVTERFQAQEQVRLARDAAERVAAELARSNKDLEQFAYVSSHDLQEPLRMVTGFMQLFEAKYRGQLDATADKYIHFAVDGARRMQQLIDDLLAYSRVGTQGRELVLADVAQVVQEAMANLSVSLAESGAEVTLGDLPTVRGDRPQLTQLFQNLLGNAVKFRGDHPPKIRVDACRDKGVWLFSVQDNGIGIDPEFSEKIFVIFQRLHTKDKYVGTGIGLAICKKIVERHNGRIWVESKAGQGSTFYFTIPV